jgi:hypothetical protein
MGAGVFDAPQLCPPKYDAEGFVQLAIATLLSVDVDVIAAGVGGARRGADSPLQLRHGSS